MSDIRKSVVLVLAAVAILAGGCQVGPKYKRPSTPAPAAFKEAPPDGWKEAQPADGELKGSWWEIYGNAELNALEEQVSISNQNVISAEARYREAKAAVRVARASLFPLVGGSVSASASRPGTGSTVSSGGSTAAASGIRTIYSLPIDVSYEPDLWGGIRRGVTASVATAQATAAQLANIRLLYQAELAQNFFQLRIVDAERDLLTRTAAAFEQYLQLTKSRLAAGVGSDLDVAQAETQLYSVQAQLIDLNVQRAALEHAIAVLMGKPPADLSLPAAILDLAPPPVPVGVPSQLLERRPDIATAERAVAAANEQIGIVKAAWYPSLILSGDVGFQASRLAKWFSLPSRFWSVGSSLAETLFDGGRRRGQVAGAEASYDGVVADYRQVVLTSFQQVEDNLAALRYLAEEAAKVQDTIAAAERSLNIATAQYKAGTVSYLEVLTTQAATLQAQRTAVALRGRRLVASVLLIEALGGGWTASQLPSRKEIVDK